MGDYNNGLDYGPKKPYPPTTGRGRFGYPPRRRGYYPPGFSRRRSGYPPRRGRYWSDK